MTSIKKGCLLAGCSAVSFILVFFGLAYYSYRQAIRSAEKARDPKEIVQELKQTSSEKLREGTAICVVLDTSGSMGESIGKPGEGRKKIDIAKETTLPMFQQLEQYRQQNPDKTLSVSLLAFSDKVHEFTTPGGISGLKAILDKLYPNGGTAIGEAIIEAKKKLNAGGFKKNFLLVVTDGENTDGRPPIYVLKALKLLPSEEQPAIYLAAFDIQATKFNDLKNEGALTLEAGNASSLQQALDYILYEKILVEEPL